MASQVILFQRTPPWVLPRRDHAVSALVRAAYRWVPGLQRLARWARYWFNEARMVAFLHPRLIRLGERQARRYLASQVADPELRAKLTPGYTMGCKRILISDDYYQALTRPNVKVVTQGIERLGPRAVHTSDGVAHEVDCVVLATGFHATDPLGPVEIAGRGGLTLRNAWAADGLSAYLGTTVAGFPNLFILAGPNTGIGHTSLVFMIEAQLHYALRAMRTVRGLADGAVEVRPEVQARFTQDLARRSRSSVWQAGGCRSWYLDEQGRNTTIWPDYTFRFWLRTRRFSMREHLVATNVPPPALEAAPR